MNEEMSQKNGRYGSALWQEFKINPGNEAADEACWWCDQPLVEGRPRTVVRLEWYDDHNEPEISCWFHAPCFAGAVALGGL